MANKTDNKNKKTDETVVNEIKQEETPETSVPEVQSEPATKPEKEPVVKLDKSNIDPTTVVNVRNGFQGKLVYQSKRSGELFVWEEFGAEQDMELGELKNARNSDKAFFANNWFMFDEPWVPEYLNVGQYYTNAVPIDEFDGLFEKSADEIGDIIDALSEGQKKSIAYRARELMNDGGIDSNSLIAALEEHLGIELTEK